MHTKAWYPFLDDLPGYDVLLYDYLGQGASSSPDEPVRSRASPATSAPCSTSSASSART